MNRNEEFLNLMLSLANRVQAEFVLTSLIPPPGLYLGKGGDGDKEQRSVLLMSVRLARQALVVAFIDRGKAIDITSDEPFI